MGSFQPHCLAQHMLGRKSWWMATPSKAQAGSHSSVAERGLSHPQHCGTDGHQSISSSQDLQGSFDVDRSELPATQRTATTTAPADWRQCFLFKYESQIALTNFLEPPYTTKL
jgi:hypothetical protein